MLIAASLAASVFATTLAGAAAPVTSTIPAITVTVAASDGVAPTLVSRVLEETDAVWRAAGITFVWRRDGVATVRTAIDAPPCVAPPLRVVIERGARAAQPPGTRLTPLGWIVFDDGRPGSEIHVSYDNAEGYMVEARPVVGLVDRMPIAQRETLMGRAMGRALAHELGHYLLSSKLHSSRGLMEATHSATEFFGIERSAFAIDAAQRQAIADRLRHSAVVVRG